MPKGSYTARIEKRLAELIINPMTIAAYRFGGHFDVTKEFTAVGPNGKASQFRLHQLRYNPRGQVCDLCGHNPINRIFGIMAVKDGKVIEVGSECIKNWVGADIAAGLAKVLDGQKNAIVNEERLANEIDALKKLIADPASRAWEVRSAQYILRRISEGMLNPILDSQRKLVAKALKAAGYKVPMTPRFGKLLKDTRKAYETLKAVQSRMEAKLAKLDYSKRWEFAKQTGWDYSISSQVRNFVATYERAEAFYAETGVICAADGKYVRQLQGKKGETPNILKVIAKF